MPKYDYLFLLHDDTDIGHAADEYSTNEVDFGMTNPDINKSGNFGLHMIVTEAFTDLDSGANLWIVHGAATSPTTKHTGMFIPVANLTLGAHFFVPCGSIPLLRYARALFDIVSESATLGEVTMYFGPGPDGAEGGP